jgi:hypothetical protein
MSSTAINVLHARSCDRAWPGPRELLLPCAVSTSMSEDELFVSVSGRRADGGGGGRGRGGRCEAAVPHWEVD